MSPNPHPHPGSIVVKAFGDGLANAYVLDPGTIGQAGVNIEIDHDNLQDHPAALLLSRSEALELAARIERAANELPMEPRPSVWVGDLRNVPPGTVPHIFWHGFTPEANETFVAVVIDGDLHAVVNEEDRSVCIWHALGIEHSEDDPVTANLLVASDDATDALKDFR